MVEEVRERVRAGGLLPADAHVVAMLSGGRDSVCLLDVAVALCGAEKVHALHVNYGLRPEADGDEAHCRELCAQLGVELEVVRAERDPDASGNLHAWARELRYAAARELADRLDGLSGGEPAAGPGPVGRSGDPMPAGEPAGRLGDPVRAGEPAAGPGPVGRSGDPMPAGEPAGRLGDPVRAGEPAAGPGPAGIARVPIATGHTSTDQVETILYRLAASPGRRALLGMSPRDGRLVRPLLGVTREQTGAYCTERGLAWREDESNDLLLYARARVRHGLLPAFDEIHPAARPNLLRTAALLRGETELLDSLVDAELRGGDGPAADAESGSTRAISLARLAELPPALARLVVIRLAEDAAGERVPQAGERVAEIVALARRGGRAELHVGGLACAVVEGGTLRMRRIEPRAQRPARGDHPAG